MKLPIKQVWFVDNMLLAGEARMMWTEAASRYKSCKLDKEANEFIFTNQGRPEIRIPVHSVKQYEIDYSKVDLRKKK